MSDGTIGGIVVITWIIAVFHLGFFPAICGSPDSLSPLRRRNSILMRALIFSMVACILFALRKWSAQEIRSDLFIEGFLLIAFQIWLAISAAGFSFLGLSIRNDAIEQANPSALVALAGAVAAVTLIFAGGNIGEGPSYANNVFSIALAGFVFFGFWLILEMTAHVSSAIAEDRDLATGIRVGAFLLSEGLILARAVAGDWHSTVATLGDFARDGAMAIVLLAVAISAERLAQRQTLANPSDWFSRGVSVGVAYVAIAIGWLIHVGPWEGFR